MNLSKNIPITLSLFCVFFCCLSVNVFASNEYLPNDSILNQSFHSKLYVTNGVVVHNQKDITIGPKKEIKKETNTKKGVIYVVKGTKVSALKQKTSANIVELANPNVKAKNKAEIKESPRQKLTKKETKKQIEHVPQPKEKIEKQSYFKSVPIGQIYNAGSLSQTSFTTLTEQTNNKKTVHHLLVLVNPVLSYTKTKTTYLHSYYQQLKNYEFASRPPPVLLYS